MPLFCRIFNNRVIPIEEVNNLGWTLEQDYFLPPDEYFERGEFVIHRGCHSIGDWGIIAAMPHLLKKNYPGCKVYVTSAKMIERLYGPANTNPQNAWGIWADPYKNVHNTFDANPHVDGYIDSYDGEIYHDHFRIRNPQYLNDPLILQMMRFHKVNLTLEDDFLPEIYFSDEEIERFEKIRRNTFGTEPYAAFSFRKFNDVKTQQRIDHVKQLVSKYNDLPFMHYSNVDIDFGLDKRIDTTGMDVRLLLYLICNATVCTGTQTGIYDMCCRYTKVDIIPSAFEIKDINEHYLPAINYNFI